MVARNNTAHDFDSSFAVPGRYSVLGVARDAKTVKSLKQGVLTGICYLSPVDLAGCGNVCPFATAGCKAVCLNTAGRGGMNVTQRSRARKTRLFRLAPDSFEACLRRDLDRLVKRAEREGYIPAVRLDGTSDVVTLWAEKRGIIADYPDVVFYGYTKRPWLQWRRALAENSNLRVTYSYNEAPNSYERAMEYLDEGCSVAVVMRNEEQVADAVYWGLWGYECIDGDEHDARFLDDGGVIVALKAKGKKARNDKSGFVIDYCAPTWAELELAEYLGEGVAA